MSEVRVIATIVAKSESVETVEGELVKLVEASRKEEGCVSYILHRDNSDPAKFVFYEVWRSAEDLARHMETVHFKDAVSGIEGLVEESVLQELTRVV